MITKAPGGNAGLIARDLSVLWHPCTQMHDHESLPPVPVASAEGAWLTDFDGRRYFDALTPGGKRSMLYFIGKIKDVDRRIEAALIFMEHLKKNGGKLNRLELSKELKRPLV